MRYGAYVYAPASNLLTRYTTGTVTTTVSSDGIGSITGLTPSSGSATALGYNAAQRLASVTVGTVAKLANTYDAFGNRTLKTAGVTNSLFLRDPGGYLLEERDTAGAALARQDTVYLGGVPLADINPDTGAIFYLHTDHLGTPQVATTSQGAVAWRGTYNAFGGVSAPKGLLTQNLRFPGQYADATTGWSQNGFRDYDPAIGRYLESDPIGLGGGVNTYAYVNDNPVNHKDPLGLCDKKPNCNTVLPNGKTIRQVVQAQMAKIKADSNDGYENLPDFAVAAAPRGPIDFKNNLGPDPTRSLGAAGNFAYGALASGVGIGQSTAEFGAGAYARYAGKANPANPYSEDNSAAQNLPAGYATNGCQN